MSKKPEPEVLTNECQGCANRDKIIESLAKHIDARNEADGLRLANENRRVAVSVQLSAAGREPLNAA